MDATMAYMARMERLYAVDSAVATDDGNDGGGGRGGKAGAPGGDRITRINRQAVAAAAVEEEEEEEGEGAVARDGDCAADGNRGPVGHRDRKDGNGSAAPRTGRMTTSTAATAMGGDRDRPARGKSDHCNDRASNRYQYGGGGKTCNGSGVSSGGRGGGNSNRTKIEEEEIQSQRRSTPIMVDFASRRGQLALNTFRSRRKMERNLFFDG